jgi:hypothetical protein
VELRFEYMARNRVADMLLPDMFYNGGFSICWQSSLDRRVAPSPSRH